MEKNKKPYVEGTALFVPKGTPVRGFMVNEELSTETHHCIRFGSKENAYSAMRFLSINEDEPMKNLHYSPRDIAASQRLRKLYRPEAEPQPWGHHISYDVKKGEVVITPIYAEDVYKDPDEELAGTYLLGYACIALASLALALISYGCWCWSNSLIGG